MSDQPQTPQDNRPEPSTPPPETPPPNLPYMEPSDIITGGHDRPPPNVIDGRFKGRG